MKSETRATLGLRERKRRETHKRITDSALILFGKKGYEATTLDEIADAANIAKRTFFHYFKSKEDILSSWQEGVPQAFHAAVLSQPSDISNFKAVRNVLLSIPEHFDADEARKLHKILRTNPELSAANDAKFHRLEKTVAEALSERNPDPGMQLSVKVTAMACIGALRLAIMDWVEQGSKSNLRDHLQLVLSHLQSEIEMD